MNKTWIIIQREYWTRVRKKSFFITTVLIPTLFAGLISLSTYLAMQNEEKLNIVIQDDSSFFIGKIDSSETYSIQYLNKPLTESTKDFIKRIHADILVHIFPFKSGRPDSIYLFKEGGVSLNSKEYIDNELSRIYQLKQMTDAGINKIQIDSIQHGHLNLKSFDLENNQETHSEIAMMVGYGVGILIYLVILIYGTGVMRGVMEEKTNRVAEVIISSVRPFQLMMGKIIGIALVGLTQFLIWIILMTLINIGLAIFLPGMRESLQGGMALSHEMNMQLLTQPQSEGALFVKNILAQNWSLISVCFLFYFLGGYFLYASMFAAVGSLVNEDPQEAQQMTIPITVPIIFAFIIMASTIKDPNGSLSIFGSLFPLTSPIVMMARIPYGVPTYQLILSMVFLIFAFILMTWLSAKIYRTGILLYGKKASWKEVIKWIRYS